MNKGYNFPILINSSKEPPITKEQFNKLSYFGLASFWCSYKLIFCDNDESIRLYTRDNNCFFVDTCIKNYRFKGIQRFEISSAEMIYCDINKDTELYKDIKKYFSHLILK